MTLLQRLLLAALGIVLMSAKRSDATKMETITTTVLQIIGVGLIVAAILGRLL